MQEIDEETEVDRLTDMVTKPAMLLLYPAEQGNTKHAPGQMWAWHTNLSTVNRAYPLQVTGCKPLAYNLHPQALPHRPVCVHMYIRSLGSGQRRGRILGMDRSHGTKRTPVDKYLDSLYLCYSSACTCPYAFIPNIL
jgi:hypothetical protein